MTTAEVQALRGGEPFTYKHSSGNWSLHAKVTVVRPSSDGEWVRVKIIEVINKGGNCTYDVGDELWADGFSSQLT